MRRKTSEEVRHAVVIRTPWSRRKVLIGTAVAAGTVGAAKLAVRLAATPEPGGGRTDEAPPALPALSRDRGQLLGIPVQSVPMLLIYDRRRLLQGGVAEPRAPWSWSQLADAAARLTRSADDGGQLAEYGFFTTAASGSVLSFL